MAKDLALKSRLLEKMLKDVKLLKMKGEVSSSEMDLSTGPIVVNTGWMNWGITTTWAWEHVNNE